VIAIWRNNTLRMMWAAFTRSVKIAMVRRYAIHSAGGLVRTAVRQLRDAFLAGQLFAGSAGPADQNIELFDASPPTPHQLTRQTMSDLPPTASPCTTVVVPAVQDPWPQLEEPPGRAADGSLPRRAGSTCGMFHNVHLGRYAFGGFGLVFVEATAVEEVA